MLGPGATLLEKWAPSEEADLPRGNRLNTPHLACLSVPKKAKRARQDFQPAEDGRDADRNRPDSERSSLVPVGQ